MIPRLFVGVPADTDTADDIVSRIALLAPDFLV